MNIREKQEQLELQVLSEYACPSIKSRGRHTEEDKCSIRTEFQRDRDRVIHSKAFRRLKHKTQVFISPDNDHYRTRLTHTLEVSQIARTIGAALRLNTDLIEAIALSHDVGHTPFSHSGEEVLNSLVPGGFRHNENSIRVLTVIEEGWMGRGLNLTKEVLDGVQCHSGFGGKNSREAYTLEGQVIKLSDKIAYVQHDIDDSIRAGILRMEDLPSGYIELLGRTHRERISTLVTDAIENSTRLLNDGKTVIRLSPPVEEALKGLREFMFKNVYFGPVCKAERDRVTYVIEFLFRYYKNNPGRMPEFYRNIADEEGLERGVCDYISGMTDNYCISRFKEITIPRSLIK
ncbi:MAG: dNTP triphosphohydrolase, broad substrate specificity [Firmicutes bacterium]|nr:dNTP triphosphohydrolase, broad substrate specificity [Bacillota bacterium]MDI6706229.1 deoxyguanosinetriphosphate triphosphohydrolase [Bacillota bacterium]